MRFHLGLPFAWGQELHPFSGDGFWHFGFLTVQWRMKPRHYAGITIGANSIIMPFNFTPRQNDKG